MNHIIRFSIATLGLLLGFQLMAATQNNYKLNSPDETIEFTLTTTNGIYYSVLKDGEVLIEPSQILLETDKLSLHSIDNSLQPVLDQQTESFDLVWGTTSNISTRYNALKLWLNSSMWLECRAYNEGVAWRYGCKDSTTMQINDEQVEFNFPDDQTVYFPKVDGFSNPFEPQYLPEVLAEVEDQQLGLTPLLFSSKTGKQVLISEVNLFSYPGMFVKKTDKGCSAIFPKYPSKEKEQLLGRMRLVNIPQFSKMMVAETEKFIAKKDCSQPFPWRAILVANSEVELLDNHLIAALAEKPKERDFSWVKPGKVVWDWYHKWNLTDVDFKPGINTETYKYMIDFAADNNIEYVNIDDGWCGLHNFNNINRNLNLDEVLSYANDRNVGIFLWATWQTLRDNLETNLDMFEKLGVAGLKVDFFDRSDQVVVDFINTLADEAAERELLLNLHGMYKPTGIQITYPNVVNLEGVLGLEYNKFSNKVTPEHNLTIPFIRNVVGPMDYTPGGMYYMAQENFEKSWKNPHVMTSKAQQMAMYVIYHGGIQMLADSPTMYEADSVALQFLSKVPVSWDQSIALEGTIGETIAIARRSGKVWYVSAMNAGVAADITIDFDFLKDATYETTLFEEGSEVDQLHKNEIHIDSSSSIRFQLKRASGVVLRIEEKQ